MMEGANIAGFTATDRSPDTNGAAWNSKTLVPRRFSPYLNHSDGETLRSLIQGTVASMTAAKLSARYEIGLENDHLYTKAVEEFRCLIVKPSTRIASLNAFVEYELPAGRPDYVKVLFLEAVARMMGREWTTDSCNFVDVTVGTAKLQQLINMLSQKLRLSSDISKPSALIVSPLGEQHTLAPHLMGLLLDTLGWDRSVLEPSELQGRRFAQLARHAQIACIGWSNSRLRTELSTLMRNLRSHRRHIHLPIIVGGAAALESVDFLVGLGVDCICDSIYSAARICESYYELERISQQSRAAGSTAVVTPSGIDWLTP